MRYLLLAIIAVFIIGCDTPTTIEPYTESMETVESVVSEITCEILRVADDPNGFTNGFYIRIGDKEHYVQLLEPIRTAESDISAGDILTMMIIDTTNPKNWVGVIINE